MNLRKNLDTTVPQRLGRHAGSHLPRHRCLLSHVCRHLHRSLQGQESINNKRAYRMCDKPFFCKLQTKNIFAQNILTKKFLSKILLSEIIGVSHSPELCTL